MQKWLSPLLWFIGLILCSLLRKCLADGCLDHFRTYENILLCWFSFKTLKENPINHFLRFLSLHRGYYDNIPIPLAREGEGCGILFCLQLWTPLLSWPPVFSLNSYRLTVMGRSITEDFRGLQDRRQRKRKPPPGGRKSCHLVPPSPDSNYCTESPHQTDRARAGRLIQHGAVKPGNPDRACASSWS